MPKSIKASFRDVGLVRELFVDEDASAEDVSFSFVTHEYYVTDITNTLSSNGMSELFKINWGLIDKDGRKEKQLSVTSKMKGLEPSQKVLSLLHTACIISEELLNSASAYLASKYSSSEYKQSGARYYKDFPEKAPTHLVERMIVGYSDAVISHAILQTSDPLKLMRVLASSDIKFRYFSKEQTFEINGADVSTYLAILEKKRIINPEVVMYFEKWSSHQWPIAKIEDEGSAAGARLSSHSQQSMFSTARINPSDTDSDKTVEEGEVSSVMPGSKS